METAGEELPNSPETVVKGNAAHLNGAGSEQSISLSVHQFGLEDKFLSQEVAGDSNCWEQEAETFGELWSCDFRILHNIREMCRNQQDRRLQMGGFEFVVK